MTWSLEREGLASDQTDFALIQLKVGRAAFPNFIFLVVDQAKGDAVVVDPGWEAELIHELILSRGLNLSAVLLTHSHIDHTGCAVELSRLASCPIYASAETAQSLKYGEQVFGILDRDEKLKIGSLHVQTLMTPGHTSCSISFLIGNRLFPGDTLFIEGCGLATEPGGNPSTLFRTVSKLKKTVPDHVRVYPAHRYHQELGQRFADIKAKNFYLRLTDEDSFVAFCNRPRRGTKPPAVGTVPNMLAEIDTSQAELHNKSSFRPVSKSLFRRLPNHA